MIAIQYMPANSLDECEALREVIVETVKTRSGVAPQELPEEARHVAKPPQLPPSRLVARSQAVEFELSEEVWQSLDEDERYALMKLGNGKVASHNLASALAEFINGDASDAHGGVKSRASMGELIFVEEKARVL